LKKAEDLQLPLVGTIAPNFNLPAIDGERVELASYPKPVALIFMRHLL